ncbi:hypothetical protein AVEN_191168-1 [Araneus ventricosus]|uniref:Uncharacterized protein n=1 Tax=Araneus ventricosus TaxID=182803 RepID=A0A4Y2AYS5_ARAVE|nr:hypothetical protein AVEN_191168-1 [Araneus ventricosus]
MASSSGNKAFRSCSKKILYNFVKFCDQEPENEKLIAPIPHPTKRASQIAGVSVSTVKKIRRESGGQLITNFTFPRKKVKKDIFEKISIDEFDCSIIRRTVHDFYVKLKKVPSLNKLLPVLKETMNFIWNKETLRQILHKIGFKWKRCQNKRKVLFEREDILKRTQFLRNIKIFRTEGRPMVYIDETWIDSNLTFNKCWQSEDAYGITPSRQCFTPYYCAGARWGFCLIQILYIKPIQRKGTIMDK